MTIGERIKKVRVRFNLNQTDFGSRISVAQTYLSQIEKGDREATDKIIRLICLQFSVSEDWLRTGEGDMLVRTDSGVFDAFVRENGLDETDSAIMRVYVSLPPASRAVLHDVIRRMADSMAPAESEYDRAARIVSEKLEEHASTTGEKEA